MSRLANAADKATPNYKGGLDMGRPENSLIEAFQAARKHLFAALPSDARLDANEAMLASQLVQQQIEAKQSIVIPSLENGQDLPETDMITLEAPKSRQYYVGKYVQASQGLGGYVADLGREAVQAGVMTEAEYVDGMEVRYRTFSEIIHAGETGQLVQLVNAESVGGDEIIKTSGTTVIVRPGMQGLGIDPVTGILIGIAIVAIVGGFAYYFTRRHSIDRSVAMMTQNCNEAMRQGNEKAVKYCTDFAREAATGGGAAQKLFGEAGTSEILRMMGYAVGGLLVVKFLPDIVDSLFKTTDVVRART
jgi:hypothetical protein